MSEIPNFQRDRVEKRNTIVFTAAVFVIGLLSVCGLLSNPQFQADLAKIINP